MPKLNKGKSLILPILFFLLFLPFVFSAEVYFLNETFNIFPFSYNISNCGYNLSSNTFNPLSSNQLPQNLIFNNVWACMYYTEQPFFNNKLISESDLNYVNSEVGLKLNAGIGQTSANNQRIVLYHVFNETSFLNDDSFLYFFAYVNTTRSLSIIFSDETGQTISTILLNASSVSSGIANTSQPFCNLANKRIIPNTKNLINISFSDLESQCNVNFTQSLKNGFNRIELVLGVWTINSPYSFYIDDFFLSYLSGENSLPNYNFSLSKITQCQNNTIENINIGLNISAFDVENDDIYYSLRQAENSYYYALIFDNKLQTTLCYPISFFGLFDLYEICGNEVIAYNSVLNLPSYLFPGLSFMRIFNLETDSEIDLQQNTIPQLKSLNGYCSLGVSANDFILLTRQNFYNNSVKMLYLNPLCNKTREAFIDLSPNGYLKDFSFAGNFYLSKKSQSPYITEFNLTFYSDILQKDKILSFAFTQNNTNKKISVYSENESGLNFLGDFTYLDFEHTSFNYIPVYLRYNTTTKTFYMELENNGISVFNASGTGFNNPDMIRYIGISNNNGDNSNFLLLENILIGGNVLNPEWSLTKPESFISRALGWNKIVLYVTDSYNKDLGIFSYSESEIYIPNCADYQQTDLSFTNSIITDSNFNILGFFKMFLGDNLKSYLISIGHYETGKSVIIWLFVFMLIIFFIFFYVTIQKSAFGFSLLASSFISFLLAYLVEYLELSIIFLILIALSLAGFVASIFIKGGNDD